MRSTNPRLPLRGLVALSALAMAADVQATIYYVSPTGDDDNPGTSVATAFLTIKKAAKVIQSGDTVYVAAGTYTDEIVVNGVQDSSTPAVFSGSSGATVTGSWKVANSNYVQIKGFTFQDTTGRFLVWQGSYEGLIEDCLFDAGDEGLLIKDGSLTIDDCQLQDFTHDGIQVDGEADVLVKDSTISGCQDAGMEIRKVARVEFNNCTVSGQVGDGIEVNVVADSIDGGFTPSDLMSGPIPLAVSNGPMGFSPGTYVDGDLYHHPDHSVNPTHVTGTLEELPTGALSPVDPGDAATNNDNSNIPLTVKGHNPLDASGDFSVGSNDSITIPAGTYYFSSMASRSPVAFSGPAIIYVTGDVDMKDLTNSSQDPNDLQLYVMGTSVDLKSDGAIYGAVYAPTANVKLLGSSLVHGMIVGASLSLNGSSTFRTDESLADLALSLVNIPPTTPLPVGWTPVASGELDVRQSTLSDNNNAVSFETAQTFDAQSTQFSSNAAWGLRLQGDVQLTNCTVNANATGGLRLKDVTDADLQIVNLALTDNIQYGVYAESSQLTFDSSNIHHWVITGSNIAVAGVGSDLAFDSVTISGGTTAGVQLTQGTLTATGTTFSGSGYGLEVDNSNVTLTDCTLSGNTIGLYANQNPSLTVNSTTITGNSQWGAAVYGGGTAGPATFDNCTIHTNVGGLSIVNGGNGELLLRGGTVLRDNSNAGLHFDNCNMTVDDQATHGWQLNDNMYGISSNNSTLVLDGITINSGTYGLWATNNVALTVNASTFSGTSAYGVYLQGPGSLHGCSITGNANGLYLHSNSVTDANLSGTDISGNTTYGVYAYNGSLDLSAQSIEGWSIDSNGYNIYGNQADISLTGATLTNATTYGVYAEYGSVALQQSVISSQLNGVSSSHATTFTIDRCHISGANAGSWAVFNYESNLTMRNSVVSGAESGVHSSEAGGAATIYNSTIANGSLYGLYACCGDLTVMNTIISGTNGSYGLYRGASADLTHTHNLVHGFTTPFYNTAADSTEVQKPPRFTDAAAGDYSLRKGSPAINAGVDLAASHTIDMLGSTRPSHQVFEIGAYEYMSNGGSFRVLDWQEKN